MAASVWRQYQRPFSFVSLDVRHAVTNGVVVAEQDSEPGHLIALAE